jgi:hypothetical protein
MLAHKMLYRLVAGVERLTAKRHPEQCRCLERHDRVSDANTLLTTSKDLLEQLLLDRVELPIGPIDEGMLARFFVGAKPLDILRPFGQKADIHSNLVRGRSESEVSLQLEPATLFEKHDLLDHGIPPADLARNAPLRQNKERTRHCERGRMEEIDVSMFGGAPNLVSPNTSYLLARQIEIHRNKYCNTCINAKKLFFLFLRRFQYIPDS